MSRWVHDLVPLRADIAEQVLETIKNRSLTSLTFVLNYYALNVLHTLLLILLQMSRFR